MSGPVNLRAYDRIVSWLIGTEPGQRSQLVMLLLTAGVHAVALSAQWLGVMVGTSPREPALWLIGFCAVSETTFYVLVRSGFTRRFQDSSLSLPHMVVAIGELAAAYLINAHARGMLLMLVAFVLTFGAFRLSPPRCRQLGWFAVAVFGLTMAWGAATDPVHFDPQTEMFHFAFSAAVLPSVAIIAAQLSRIRIDNRAQRHALRQALERLQQAATHDELTALPNRRHIVEWFAQEASRQQRSPRPMALAILDLDHFKRINDQAGHAAGDAVLRTFALEAGSLLRAGDVLARWGGEEFVLVMPDSTREVALGAIERLRAHLAQASVWPGQQRAPITFSAGLTEYRSPQSLDDTLRRADAALYEAKRLGRNRSSVA